MALAYLFSSLPATAAHQRIFGAMDCVTPVPLQRWDLERINATDDILQVQSEIWL